MQRERLEGWMVKQIAHADLAKEAVLQLPSRANAAFKYSEDGTRIASLPTSPRKSSSIASSCSPRRRPITSQFSTTTDSENLRNGASGMANPSGIFAGLTPQSPPRQRTSGGGGRKNSISPDAIPTTATNKQHLLDFLPLHSFNACLLALFARLLMLNVGYGCVFCTSKKQAEERMERNRRQREQLVRQEELRLEARLEKYQQRFAVKKQLTAEELANTVGFRRRKLRLSAVAFVLVTNKWHAKFQHMKQVLLLAKQQSRAAKTIQRLWRKWKWRHMSKHTVIIYTWLRKCMWKLLFNARCRRKARVASILQRFMADHFSGSRETRNFNRMMVKWRGKVIHSQRLGMTFVQCTRARLHALLLWWDRIDHERQRSERQHHERFLPTEEKEAEWAAMLHSRKLVKRTSQRFSINTNSTASLHTSSSTMMGGMGSNSSNNNSFSISSNNNTSSPRNKNNSSGGGGGGGTLTQLEHMNEKLTTMQQVLTPFEIQRLQQNAYHVVRITKSIKMQLLQEYLTSARKEYIQRLNHFNEQRLCASFPREVRLDDARAIVQNSHSWGNLLVDQRHNCGGGTRGNSGKHTSLQPRPTLELFAGERQRKRMDELVKKGVQLTLERDHEQRFVVERQRQQRLSMDLNGSSGLRPGSSKKRESGTGIGTGACTGQSSSSGDTPSLPGGLRKRQSSRHLAFMLPFKEEPLLPKTTVLEDVDME